MEKFNKNKYAFSKKPGLLALGHKFDKARCEELSLLRKEAYLYDVHIKELSRLNPSYENRNLILNIALFIIEDKIILDSLYKRRKLNIVTVNQKTKVNKDFMSKWYDYIVFYTLLFSNENYKHIQGYFRVIELENTNQTGLEKYENENNTKGLVIKRNNKSLNILTNTGDIIIVKKDDVTVGEEYEGIEKDFLKRNKFKLLAVFIILIVLGGGYFYQYNKKTTTVLVNTTSVIKLETNKFNKILYSYSETEKGEEMLKEIKPNGEKLDVALLNILKYSAEHKMTPEKGFAITINGTSVNVKSLKQTGEYIYNEKIHLDINNNGVPLNLYTIIKNQKEELNED